MIGGKRAGAGRKRAVEGELLTTVAFGLAQRHVEAIKQWQMDHRSKSASEAVRQIIDVVHDTAVHTHEDNAQKCDVCGSTLLFGPHDHTSKSLEKLLTEPSPLPAGDENSPDWQWKRQPISRPTKESRPKHAKPNSKSKGD